MSTRTALEDAILWWPTVYAVTVDCPWCRKPTLKVDLRREDVRCASCGMHGTMESAVDARADAEMRLPLASAAKS